MGKRIFGLDIATIIGAALSGNVSSGKLYIPTSSGRSRSALTSGRDTTYTVYDFEGFEDSIQDVADANTNTVILKRVLNIVAASLPNDVKPVNDARAEIDGSVFALGEVSTDPAEALYVCDIVN